MARCSNAAQLSASDGGAPAGTKQLECRRLAGQTHAALKYGRIDKILASGLHEFLSSFIVSNSTLGVQLQEDFLMVPTPVAMAGAA